VRARRLARSALTERSSSLVDVVREVGGIHAQVQASAELQLAARVDGITQQDVRDALWRDRTLVKAWTLRGSALTVRRIATRSAFAIAGS